MSRTLMTVVAGAVLLAACATPATTSSGFLTDYSTLESGDEGSDQVRSMVVEPPELESYTMAIVPPVRILAKNLTEEQSAAVQQSVQEAVEMEIGKYWPLTTEPGADTFKVRVAVTDVHKSNVALNVVTTAVLMPVDFGTITIESEVSNSETGMPLAALVWAKKSGLKQTFQTFTPTGSSRALAPDFARDLAALLGKTEEDAEEAG